MDSLGTQMHTLTFNERKENEENDCGLCLFNGFLCGMDHGRSPEDCR